MHFGSGGCGFCCSLPCDMESRGRGRHPAQGLWTCSVSHRTPDFSSQSTASAHVNGRLLWGSTNKTLGLTMGSAKDGAKVN